MTRPLTEIADDLDAIEQVIKNNAHAMIHTAAKLAGTTIPSDVPDVRQVPQLIVLPDGRKLEISQIAQELREHARHEGDFRER